MRKIIALLSISITSACFCIISSDGRIPEKRIFLILLDGKKSQLQDSFC